MLTAPVTVCCSWKTCWRATRALGMPSKPVSPTSVRAGLDVFAKLHARFWQRQELSEMSWINDGGALARDGMFEAMFAQAHWDRCMSLPRAQHVAAPMRDREVILQAVKKMFELGKHLGQTVVHGDPHVGNTIYERDG